MTTYNGRNWCGTINNWEDSHLEADGPGAWLKSLVDRGICNYAVGQYEEGEERHTQHLQLFLQLKQPKRLTWMRRHVDERAHWEPMRGTPEQAAAYCKKEETRVGGPWEYGTLVQRGKKVGLEDAVQLVMNGAPLREVITQFPVIWVHHGRGLVDLRQRLNLDRDRRTFDDNGPEVWVLWGPSGTGKSRFVARAWPDAFWKIPGEKWWDGYDEHETVVLDDFKDGDLRLTDLQRLLDRYPLWVEVKGGAVPMLAKRYVITSNTHPDEWYPRAVTHKTILRRINDYAAAFGRLIHCDEGWSPDDDLQLSLGNTRVQGLLPNLADALQVRDTFDRDIERIHSDPDEVD